MLRKDNSRQQKFYTRPKPVEESPFARLLNKQIKFIKKKGTHAEIVKLAKKQEYVHTRLLQHINKQYNKKKIHITGK